MPLPLGVMGPEQQELLVAELNRRDLTNLISAIMPFTSKASKVSPPWRRLWPLARTEAVSAAQACAAMLLAGSTRRCHVAIGTRSIAWRRRVFGRLGGGAANGSRGHVSGEPAARSNGWGVGAAVKSVPDRLNQAVPLCNAAA